MPKVKVGVPKGTRDFSPEVVRKREYIIGTIKNIFELYGFQPLETPAIELLEVLDLQHRLLAERDFLPSRARRGQGDNFRYRKIPLRQGFQYLAPDCPGGADDRDPVTHDLFLPNGDPSGRTNAQR